MHVDIGHPEAALLLAEFVSGVLGQPIDVASVLTAGEQAMLFRHLSRADELGKERRAGERLVWTCDDLTDADRERLPVPHLDEFVIGLRSRLPVGSSPTRPRWPENRPFAVCLSHDMDHVTSFAGRANWRQLARMRRNGAGAKERARQFYRALRTTIGGSVRRLAGHPDHFGNVGDWLKLEADCGFKSSLFFFAKTVHPWHRFDCNYGFADRVEFEGRATSVGSMMGEIAQRGWDVGVHGSIASATEPGVLALQKHEVESITGRPVLTTRQHYLQYDPRLTPRIQADAGLLADGTQGFNDAIGFRAGTSFPYRVWDWSVGRLLPLWQVPLHIQDGPLLRNRRTVREAVGACVGILDHVQRAGGCLGLLFHPASLATDFGFATYREVLWEARHRGAWGCTMRQATEHWQQHIRAVIADDSVIPQ